MDTIAKMYFYFKKYCLRITLYNDVESLVLFPLKANDELMGYMWVTNFDTELLQRASRKET
jgi:hypothetical protein